MERMEFIATIKPACLDAEKTWGISWRWLVYQAIQESGGYGKSDLSVNAFNLYGIKGANYFQGKVGYAKFDSWEDCIEFQGWQLNQSRYLPFKPLVQQGKYKEYGNAIQKAGWCAPSTPGYGDMIYEIAEEYAGVLKDPVTSSLTNAQSWAVESGVFDEPVDWDKPVTYNTLAWALFKARGGKA
jgi:flagellum-specific peptidoglycan hydrolase FlgJ